MSDVTVSVWTGASRWQGCLVVVLGKAPRGSGGIYPSQWRLYVCNIFTLSLSLFRYQMIFHMGIEMSVWSKCVNVQISCASTCVWRTLVRFKHIPAMERLKCQPTWIVFRCQTTLVAQLPHARQLLFCEYTNVELPVNCWTIPLSDQRHCPNIS